MGFGQLEVEFLLHEHRYQPFVGQALSIGKQAVAMKPESMIDLLKAYKIEPKTTSFKLDKKNWHNAPGSGWITDESFFASFAECKLFSADISDYEGADFIFDICSEVPPELIGRFDFLMDGGSLDNVWDPPQMLRNMTKMLKPGGASSFMRGQTRSHGIFENHPRLDHGLFCSQRICRRQGVHGAPSVDSAGRKVAVYVAF
jgi:hypothetical protein